MNLSLALSIGLFASSATDFITTRQVFSRGGYEQNTIAGSSPYRQAAVSMAGAGGTFLALRSIDKSHPKLSLGLKLGYVCSRVFISARNSRIR